MIRADERLIVALDVPSVGDAKRLVEELTGTVSFFKIGLELQFEAGRPFIDWLLGRGNRVFLDLKFFDVEETVRRATSQVARMGVHFLTVHGNRAIVKAALSSAQNSHLKILAVTVLTNMDSSDMWEFGFDCSVPNLVMHRAKMAIDSGCHGAITSGREVASIRKRAKDDFILVVPGIRPSGNDKHDHKRSVTPAMAIASGADYLVIGRPIRDAVSPKKATEAIWAEMQTAFDARALASAAPASGTAVPSVTHEPV
jgi:orotidine-5'-phosphate decarboxylase